MAQDGKIRMGELTTKVQAIGAIMGSDKVKEHRTPRIKKKKQDINNPKYWKHKG